jgi:L-carnitine CoA-transferase
MTAPQPDPVDDRCPPDFGPLAGVRVVHSGQALAGPFASSMMADFGADVLWIESPLTPEYLRGANPWLFEMDRRNQRTLSLNVPTPEGKEILLKLLETADIFVESSRGGQYARWGLTDEVLWDRNPALVIVHVSGYGQEGEERYVNRASFDPIAQAFGCYMQHNGPPDGAPLPAHPFPGDYLTALFALAGALSALHRSRATGRGDSIDVAMYEVLMRVGGAGPMAYLNEGIVPRRQSTRELHGAGTGVMECADGESVYVITRGAGVIARALRLVGLEPDSELFPRGVPAFPLDTEAGKLLDRKIVEYCQAHPAEEVDRTLNEHGIPCSRIYTYDVAEHDPHYVARQVFTEWVGSHGAPVRGVNVFPRFSERPGRVWTGSPAAGLDTAAVLADLGFAPAEIEALAAARVVQTGS